MDYYEQIKQNHCAVSFSESRQVYYVCLWNGVLRDGKVDDIDIKFIETPDIKIVDNKMFYSNKNITLTPTQINNLSMFK